MPITETTKQVRAEWKVLCPSLSPKLFSRDSYTCAYCGITDSLTIDHIIPISRGGTNAENNLTTVCGRCNKDKGGKMLSEWLGQPDESKERSFPSWVQFRKCFEGENR